jgi:hypothetical protein
MTVSQQILKIKVYLTILLKMLLNMFRFLNLIYKGESVCVCMYVRRPAAGPTQAITPKFGVGSSFHPGSAPYM